MSESFQMKALLIPLIFQLSVATVLPKPTAVELTDVAAHSVSVDDGALTVTPLFPKDRRVLSDQSIELILSRDLNKTESRVAIFFGTTDVSGLFRAEKRRLRYDATTWPLPLGEVHLTAYVVSSDENWKQIGQFWFTVVSKTASSNENSPLSMITPQFLKARFFDTEKPDEKQQADSASKSKSRGVFNLVPSLNIGLKTQPTQSTTPASTSNDRNTFADFTTQASLKMNGSYGLFSSESSFEFAGSSFQQEALRFGTLGDAAPNVDLAGYLVQFKTGRVKYQVGHFSFGTQRQLVNSFSSRGINISVPFLKYFDFTAAAMNGTQLVGYDNFFGLSIRRHQMLSGTLGIEILPKRPGGLRVEIGVLSAYFQPVSGENRGVITDLQRSRGISLRLIGTDKSGRFKFDGGFTRSFFENPLDQTLAQGANLEPLAGTARNAHYIDASYEVLRNFSITKTKKANLTIAFREENVAPLFRSLGASTQADKIQYEFAINGSVEEIVAQFGYSNFHDNLREIPSILRTITGSTQFSVSAPAKVFLNRTKDSVWLPRLGYSFSRIHSRADAIPVNGGFEVDPTSIPNLIGTNQTFTSDWQINKFAVGYSINHSFQNNEQTGQELSDQSVLVNTGRLGVAINSQLNLNFDLSAESSFNRETGRIDRNFRVGPGLSCQVGKLGFTANLANNIAKDDAETSRSRNTEFDASFTYRFGAGKEGLKKVAGQFFIRYANRYSHSFDRIFLVDSLRKSQTLTANLSFTFF